MRHGDAPLVDSISRAWAVVTSAEVARLGFGLVASFVVARSLGPADYGVYAVFAAAVGILGALAEGGLSEAAVLRLARGGLPHSARAFVWLRIGLAVAVVALLCLFAAPLAAYVLHIPDDGTLTRLALLGIVATACSGALSVLLQAAGRFGQMSALTLFNTALTAGLAVALALVGALNLLSALLVLGIGTSLATAALGYRLLRADLRAPSGGVLRGEASALLRVGRWLWVASVLAMLAANLDVLIVNRFVAPEVVGAYALAVSLASKASVVNHSLYTVLLPSVGQLSDADSMRRYLRQSLVRSGAVALLLVVCVPLAAPFVLIVYGADFAPAIPLLQLLLGVVIFDVLATPVVLLPLAYGRPRQMAAADALRAAVLAGVALALVPTVGAFGAVAARLAARVSGALLVIWLVVRSGTTFEVQHEETAQVSQSG
jgi:O-antigen/teichoic acid export membrane protein